MRDKERSEKGMGIDQVIDRLLKAYQLDGRMREMDIISAWEEMMGKAVANRTDRLSIHAGVLHIKLNSSVMRDELLHGKQVIIERVNQKAGEELIRDVWFE